MIEFPKLEIFAEQRVTERQLPWTRRLSKFDTIIQEKTPTQPIGLQVCDSRGLYALQFPSLLRLFSVRTRKKVMDFRKCEDVSCFSFHHNGRMILTGDIHGTARLISLDHKSILKDMKVCKQRLREMSFEPYGDRFCVASEAGDIHLWDFTASMEVIRIPKAHSDVIRRVRFVEEGRCLLTASLDCSLKLFDLRSGESLRQLSLAAEVEDVDVLGDHTLCAVHGRKVSVWDWRDFSHSVAEATVGAKSLTRVKATPGVIFTAGNDGFIRCFDTAGTDGRLELIGYRHFDSGIPLFDCDQKLKSMCVVSLNTGIKILVKGQTEEEEKPLTAEQQLLAKLRQGVLARDTTSRKFFNRGRWQKPVNFDVMIDRPSTPRFTRYEKLLRKFQFSEAFSEALRTRNTSVIIGIVENLAAQGSLDVAVNGLEDEDAVFLLQFCTKKLDSYNHYIEAQQLIDLLLASPFTNRSNEVAQKEIKSLYTKIEEEISMSLLSGDILGLIEGLSTQFE